MNLTSICPVMARAGTAMGFFDSVHHGGPPPSSAWSSDHAAAILDRAERVSVHREPTETQPARGTGEGFPCQCRGLFLALQGAYWLKMNSFVFKSAQRMFS